MDAWRRFGFQFKMIWRSPILLADKVALCLDVATSMRYERHVLSRELFGWASRCSIKS